MERSNRIRIGRLLRLWNPVLLTLSLLVSAYFLLIDPVYRPTIVHTRWSVNLAWALSREDVLKKPASQYMSFDENAKAAYEYHFEDFGACAKISLISQSGVRDRREIVYMVHRRERLFREYYYVTNGVVRMFSAE